GIRDKLVTGVQTCALPISGFSFAGRGSYSYQAANDLDPGTAAGFATGLSSKQNQQGLAAGFGVGYKRGEFGLGVDYAWRSMGLRSEERRVGKEWMSRVADV